MTIKLKSVQRASELLGGPSALARALGVLPGGFHVWDRVPAEHVLPMARLTGIPPHKIRPDLYPRGEISWAPPPDCPFLN